MLSVFTLVTVLVLPGMAEPFVSRETVASFEDCLARVAEAGAALAAHEGEQFKFAVACEVTGAKADPA